MPETTEEKPKEAAEKEIGKKKGKWFSRIPREILFSPGGIVLLTMAGIMEVIDLIPLPVIENLWELPLEIIFIVFLGVIAKVPLQSAIIPLLIERIPFVSDILPTWFLRLIM